MWCIPFKEKPISPPLAHLEAIPLGCWVLGVVEYQMRHNRGLDKGEKGRRGSFQTPSTLGMYWVGMYKCR